MFCLVLKPGVADLSINDLIGWNHRNLGRFIGVNEHCSFTSVNRPRICGSGILLAGIFGQWGLLHSTPAVSIRRYNVAVNPPIYRLVGPLL